VVLVVSVGISIRAPCALGNGAMESRPVGSMMFFNQIFGAMIAALLSPWLHKKLHHEGRGGIPDRDVWGWPTLWHRRK
jgi:membrane associated rhomboid family serine protease